MSDTMLHTYLNNHLAGATTGIELARHCRETFEQETELAALLDELIGEIEQDKQTLEQVLKRAGGEPSATKAGLGWMAEKADRLYTATAAREVSRLAQLELLLMGIHGKWLLWEALLVTNADDPRFEGLDFTHLRDRARHQHDRLKQHHDQAARRALAGG